MRGTIQHVIMQAQGVTPGPAALDHAGHEGSALHCLPQAHVITYACTQE